MTDTRTPSYGTVDTDYARRLASTPPEDDGPVWMLNLMSYHDVAQYGDDSDAPVSGREADDRYAPLDVLADIGAEPVFFAEVDSQLLGPTPRWDRVAIVRYPTRRSFIDMQARPDFKEKHVHKEAGMAATIVAGCQPIASPADGMDPESFASWDEVAHPPTDEDGPVVVLHLIRFHPGQADDHMVSYQQAAALTAVPHGVRIGPLSDDEPFSGWYGVEGTIVGDGRQWDQARFNAFPSRAAFMAVVTDPARLEAQRDHRETAIADTYTLILRPIMGRRDTSTRSTDTDTETP